MAYALEIEEKLLEHVKNAQSAFSEFGRAIAKIEPIELIKEYMVAFGSVEPLNGKSAPPLMLTRSRITPTSIVLFDNKDFKLSLRELNNSDKIVASNCCWSIFPLKNTSLNLYSLPTNLKSKDDNWPEQIVLDKSVELNSNQQFDICDYVGFRSTSPDSVMAFVLEAKSHYTTKATYSNQHLLESVISNSLDNDRVLCVLNCIDTMLNDAEVKNKEQLIELCTAQLEHEYFLIRWQALKILVNHLGFDSNILQQFLTDKNDIIKNNIQKILNS